MYPSSTYGSPPPELSNNPFIDHSSNVLSRYPDINSVDNATGGSQFASWTQPSGNSVNTPAGYVSQQQLGGNGYQRPQQTGWNQTGGGQLQPQQQQGAYGYGAPIQQQPTGMPFQPTSSFGQQLAGAVNGSYGTPQPQQQPQYSGYPTSPNQYNSGYQGGFGSQQYPQQQQNSYMSEFDPYTQKQNQGPNYGSSQAGQGSGYKPPHPREYVQQHKGELEAWDSYTWKQALSSFDGLKEAWGGRKRDIENRVRSMGGAGLFGGGGYGGGYGGYGQGQEVARLEQLAKQAESNYDSVAASAFQMQEVFSGYRQSGDLASKRRVRESINAALQSLPDWPSQTL